MSSPDNHTAWSGAYFDGRTAARHPVTIVLGPSGLELRLADASRIYWPYREITQTQGSYSHEPVRLERGAPLAEAVVVEDPAFLVALRRRALTEKERFGGPLARPDRVRLGILAALATIAATVLLLIWGFPALAELITPLIPASWEVALGDSIVPQLAPVELRCTDGRLRQTVDALVRRLAAARPGAPYSFHVSIVDRPVFNAFAAPGGRIVIFRGLLQATASPEELAGVLAHEMQHVLHRHAMKALVRDLSIAALVGAAFGDVSGVGALAVQGARTLTTLHYSRQTEEEADLEGFRLLQAARIDPAGMVRFFEALKQRTGGVAGPPYLATHPDTDERLAMMKALAARESGTDLKSVPIPLLPDLDWAEVKSLCR